MNGKVNTSRPVLDYTEMAQPITMTLIHEDIVEVMERWAEEPGEIIIWEHQGDWLYKQAVIRGELRRESQLSFTDEEGAVPQLRFAWGVPVRYAPTTIQVDR